MEMFRTPDDGRVLKIATTMNSYRPHKNLPPLAGLGSFEEAARPGMPVEKCVARLKRFHYCLWRLHQISLAHIAEEPVYELKMAFSLHAHLAAENDTRARKNPPSRPGGFL